MIACGDCFSQAAWVTAVPVDGTPGTCDFGHGYSAKTWLTTSWADYILPIKEIYSSALGSEPDAAPLGAKLQSDWQIFDLDDAQSHRFLESAMPEVDWTAVVHVVYEDTEGVQNHALSWAGFVEEITTRNRFFPQSQVDRESLFTAASTSETVVRSGTDIYRVRRSPPGSVLPISKMGAPPIEVTRAGRANPVGISYLYAALDATTAIHEARIPNQETCSVAIFRLNRDLRVLNLANVDAPDPFAGDNLVRRLSYAAYLRELAEELSKPTRDSDREITYVPTQYFCELAKTSGLDGVLYSSSIVPGHVNIVVFDETLATGMELVRPARVSGIASTWDFLDE